MPTSRPKSSWWSRRRCFSIRSRRPRRAHSVLSTCTGALGTQLAAAAVSLTALSTHFVIPQRASKGHHLRPCLHIRRLLPALVRTVARMAGLPSPIDVFSALGGNLVLEKPFACSRLARSPPWQCSLFRCDRVHPNDQGNALLARTIIDAVVPAEVSPGQEQDVR